MIDSVQRSRRLVAQFMVVAVAALALAVAKGSAQTIDDTPPNVNGRQFRAVSISTNQCPVLQPPAGATVLVYTATELRNAVNSAQPGSTILISDGTYNLSALVTS